MAMHIIYSRIMLYRGVVWVYPVVLRRICVLFSPVGCGFSILSSMHYIPWIFSMYTYCMHFSQSHKAPQNKTASDRQKLKFTNPILTIFGEPSQYIRSSPTGYKGFCP